MHGEIKLINLKKPQNRLNLDHLDRELQLVVELRYQQVVTEGLPHLHDAHHCCIDLILSVLKHTLCGAHLLLYL